MIHGETVHSPLPQDLPWWMADHAVFFGVLYIVIAILAIGMGITIMQSWKDACNAEHGDHH